MSSNIVYGLYEIQEEKFKSDLKPDWDLLNILH